MHTHRRRTRMHACRLLLPPPPPPHTHTRPAGSFYPFMIYTVVATAIASVFTIVPFLVAPARVDLDKSSAYECGFDAFGDSRQTFSVSFYLVAIMYLLFDIEVRGGGDVGLAWQPPPRAGAGPRRLVRVALPSRFITILLLPGWAAALAVLRFKCLHCSSARWRWWLLPRSAQRAA